MGILATILIGLLVGIIAKLLMPGKDPGGFIITTLLGIAGAFIAAFLGQSMGFYQADEPAGFIAAVLGAALVLVVGHYLKQRKTAVPQQSLR